MDSDFAKTARTLRERAGLSLSVLARRIHYSKAAIGHVETGFRAPTSELAKALDAALNASGLLIALASVLTKARRNVEDVRRREMLKAISASSAGLGVPMLLSGADCPAQRAGSIDVDAIVTRTAQLRRLDNSIGGADTYRMFLAEVQATESTLKHANYSARTEQALCAVLSEQCQLAGWAAFDAGWADIAEDLFEKSRAAAGNANDRGLLANSLALRAYQRAFTGSPDADMARASCTLLDPTVSARVRALAWDRAAWTFAIIGERAESEAALGQAEAAIDEAANRAHPDWAAWVDQTEIQIMSGRCWSALRRPLRAVPVLTDAIACFPDEYGRDKALYLLALADAYIHGSEIEMAASTIVHAFSLTKGVASTRPKARIAKTLALLAPIKAEAVSNLRATLREASRSD